MEKKQSLILVTTFVVCITNTCNGNLLLYPTPAVSPRNLLHSKQGRFNGKCIQTQLFYVCKNEYTIIVKYLCSPTGTEGQVILACNPASYSEFRRIWLHLKAIYSDLGLLRDLKLAGGGEGWNGR